MKEHQDRARLDHAAQEGSTEAWSPWGSHPFQDVSPTEAGRGLQGTTGCYAPRGTSPGYFQRITHERKIHF